MVQQLRIFFGVCILSAVSYSLPAQLQADCKPARAQVDLDINNVRARLYASGYMWGGDWYNWTYEIPKGSGLHTITSGGIWIGGFDPQGQLHIAASSYLTNYGCEFWPGPIDMRNISTTDSVCKQFDRLWKLNRADVESFLINRNDPNYVVPEAIRSWPGNGNAAYGHASYLAPFNDVNGDGLYNYTQGDYPGFNFSGTNNCDYDLLGDQAVWWVFNDIGNSHTQTQGAPFGFEIQGTAYSYRSSNDKLNDATFYRYKIINRSSTAYSNMQFAVWGEIGAGSNYDDYFGCDVARGLAFIYNGDSLDFDTSAAGWYYGVHPPAIGIDYIGGPLAEPGDFIDNDRDLTTDEPGERCQMSHSLWYTNSCCINDEPNTAEEHMWYLLGIWKDGSHLTYGGTGYGGTQICDFMFPGNSDPVGWGSYGVPMNAWDEYTTGNLPGRRRSVNSVGPFSLQPGEFEVITTAVPWARDMNGDNLDAVDRLKEADDYIQSLFDNCFSIPCADQQLPEITCTVRGHNAAFTLLSEGTAWSWDFGDGGTSSAKHPLHSYSSPGDYVVCVNVTTPCGTLSDCDTIHIADELHPCGPVMWRIEGQGNGKQNLEFTSETVEEILLQGRSWFPRYAEAHGPVMISYEDYNALQDGVYYIAFDSVANSAHWKMWKVGATDTVFSDSSIASGAIQRISMWGLGVQMTQVPKVGSGNNEDRNGYLTSSVTFADPSKPWLGGVHDNDTYDNSDNWIRSGALTTTGTCNAEFNDRFQGATALDRNEDFENVVNGTWGPYRVAAYNPLPTMPICYSLGPAWWPSPAAAVVMNKIEHLANVDVIITNDKSKWTRCPVVETGSQWVMNENDAEAFHLRAALSVDKEGRTVQNGGISDPDNPEAADYIGATGMGWFPGYAINLETGERLNMAFGENSSFTQENGRDMLWNPTENEHQSLAGELWGGCHYIYVFGHNGDATFTTPVQLAGELKDIPLYDAGKAAYTILSFDNTSNPELREVYADAMWVTIPVLNPGYSLMQCDVTIKLRVQKPYAKYATSSTPMNNNFPLYGFRIDKNDLHCNLYPNETRVFPNPFHDECVIQFANPDYIATDLKLYDMRGRLVRVYEDYTTDRIVISGAGLEEGVYNWSLEMEGREPERGKVILR